jgi:hypothetical protein
MTLTLSFFDSEQILKTLQGYLHLSLGNSTINKLAFNQNNTRKNPDNKQTSLVPDPEKILKSRRYLKQTASSTNKIYQPKFT